MTESVSTIISPAHPFCQRSECQRCTEVITAQDSDSPIPYIRRAFLRDGTVMGPFSVVTSNLPNKSGPGRSRVAVGFETEASQKRRHMALGAWDVKRALKTFEAASKSESASKSGLKLAEERYKSKLASFMSAYNLSQAEALSMDATALIEYTKAEDGVTFEEASTDCRCVLSCHHG